MRTFRPFLAVALAALLTLGCSGGGRVIPRGKMARIYAEMFVVDQWLKADRTAAREADTSLVYGAIFDKYGVTPADYRKSIRHYIDDPDRFSRILEKTQKVLQAHLDQMTEEDRLRGILDSLRRERAGHSWSVPVPLAELLDVPHRTDTLVLEWDSTGRYVIRHPLTDTLFRGPVLVLTDLDSLRRADSLETARLDSLRRVDSLACARADSVFRARRDSLLRDSLSRGLFAPAQADSVRALLRADSLRKARLDSLRKDSLLRRSDSLQRPRRLQMDRSDVEPLIPSR